MTEIQLVGRHSCIQEGRLGVLEADDENMKDWQERQNGSLGKLADKIDKLNEKTDRSRWAVIALLLGVVADLVLRLVGVN